MAGGHTSRFCSKHRQIGLLSSCGDSLYRASPRLKDADIPEAAFSDLYVELMLMTRKMFVECRLVHADLSEYNILYHVDDSVSEGGG